jgi:hypothetical protein
MSKSTCQDTVQDIDFLPFFLSFFQFSSPSEHLLRRISRRGCRETARTLTPLLATQVARVWFPVPARPTFSVEKVALFCNPASGATFSSTANDIIKWIKKKCSSASKGVPHLEVWVRLGRGIPHVKGHNSVLQLSYSKKLMRYIKKKQKVWFGIGF